MAVDTARLQIGLLGDLQILADGQPVDLGGAKQRLLLAMLAVTRGRPVSADALAEELWGSQPSVETVSGLQNLVSRTRRVLPTGLAIAARDPGYTLEVDAAEVDVDRFGELVALGRDRGTRGAAAEAADALRAALALWRGAALAEFAGRPFAAAWASGLEEERRSTVEALADALLATGRPAEAAKVLEPLVAQAPFREAACERLMLALYRCGRQADALGAFRTVRAALDSELGLEPNPSLRQLEARILAQSPDLNAAPGPAVAAARAGEMRAFLFTDIEASTRRWEGEEAAMAADLARHDSLLRRVVEAHAGRVMSHTGDGICADFPTASAALDAAVAAQLTLRAEPWRGRSPLRVRMAVHAGAAEARDDSWFGPTLNRTARLMALAAGGQVLCSQAAADLAQDGLAAEVSLTDLGEHRLVGLARPERVFGVGHAELPESFPTLGSELTRRHNLPTGLSTFLGRHAELRELTELLETERLVTLWGPGGAGKTRLSLEVAAECLPQFPDGVWFVELAPLDRPESVAPAVMSALGMLIESDDPLAALRKYLAGRKALLVLDNCEHLLEGAAAVVHAVLRDCPGVRVLASSREPLAVAGERAWSIPFLSLPAPDADLAALAESDAVALFAERAAAAHAGFALSESNAAAVAEICHRLDGSPLALELAAARVRVLGVKGMAERLDDRFRVLTGGPRSADARHQTLQAAVDWSWDLLPPAEQDLLAQLAIFPGSFDLQAAEAVGGTEAPAAGFEVLDLLTRLVEKSLVVALDDGRDGVRYRLLETIRQYGRLKLGDQRAAVARRHLEHFLTRPCARLYGAISWDYDWQVDAQPEQDNFRAAMDFAVATEDGHAAVRLAGGLWPYWVWAAFPGARDWLERALALTDPRRDVPTAAALTGLGWYTGDIAHFREAEAIAEELADASMQAYVWFWATGLAGRMEGAAERYPITEALQRCDAVGATYLAAWCHYVLAWRALSAGDGAEARACIERALACARNAGRSPFADSGFVGTLGVAAAVVGDGETARRRAEESVRAARAQGFDGTVAMTLTWSAMGAAITSDWPRAGDALRELLVLLRRLGTHRWVGDALEIAALTLAGTGKPAHAAQVLRAADEHRARHGERSGGEMPVLLRMIEASRDRLGAVTPTAAEPIDPLLAALHALDAETSGRPNERSL